MEEKGGHLVEIAAVDIYGQLVPRYMGWSIIGTSPKKKPVKHVKHMPISMRNAKSRHILTLPRHQSLCRKRCIPICQHAIVDKPRRVVAFFGQKEANPTPNMPVRRCRAKEEYIKGMSGVH